LTCWIKIGFLYLFTSRGTVPRISDEQARILFTACAKDKLRPCYSKLNQPGRWTNEGQLRFGVAGQPGAAVLQGNYDQLNRDIHTAYNSGYRSRAASPDAQRNALSEKLHGTNSEFVAGRAF